MPGDLNGETILLTGATGFIGSRLLHRLTRLTDSPLVILSRRPISIDHPNAVVVEASLENLSPATWQPGGY